MQSTKVRKKPISTLTEEGYCVIPVEDLKSCSDMKPSEFKLFLACWTSDRFGSRFQCLGGYDWKSRSFHNARKTIEGLGLFQFRKILDYADNKSVAYWEVRNLKGSRVKISPEESNFDEPYGKSPADNSTKVHPTAAKMQQTEPETLSKTGVENSSISPQYPLNISSEEILRDSPTEKSFASEQNSSQPKEEEKPREFGFDKGRSFDKGASTAKNWDCDTAEGRKAVEKEFRVDRETPSYKAAKEEGVSRINSILAKCVEKKISQERNPFRRQRMKNNLIEKMPSFAKNVYNMDVEDKLRSECSSYSENLVDLVNLEEEEDIW